MNTAMENTVSTDNISPTDDRKHSPPAFLDLADSVCPSPLPLFLHFLCAPFQSPFIHSFTILTPFLSMQRVELKRIEHERQRALQRKIFEDQMRMLEHQQAQELLTIPYDPNALGNGGIQHLAASAPTTPPRVNTTLNGDMLNGLRSGRAHAVDADSLSKAVGAADKRKSVTYAPSVNLSPDPMGAISRSAGAKSMPASRRTSASSHDEEIASHLQNLALVGDRSNRASPVPHPVSASILNRGSRYGDEEPRYNGAFNAGMMLDEQLDQEMHSM